MHINASCSISYDGAVIFMDTCMHFYRVLQYVKLLLFPALNDDAI